MRVLHVGTGVLPVSARAGRSVDETIYHLARNLAESGCLVDVIDIPSGEAQEPGLRRKYVWSPPVGGTSLLGYLFKVMVFSLQIPALLRRLSLDGIDVVHAHSQFPAVAVLLACRFFGLKIPLVYTAHNPHLLSPTGWRHWLAYLPMEGWVMRRADAVVAQTAAVGKVLTARFRVPEQRIIQIFAGYDAVAVEKFLDSHPAGAPGPPLILCPGIINPRKNQMAVIEAASAIRKASPECRFIFPGKVDDPAYLARLQRRIEELGLASAVDFPGHLSFERLFELYRDATVFIFPTLQESQGKVLIEAMAFGLPVIASRIGPIENVVDLDEGSAILVEPGDSGAIAGETIRLLGDASLRQAMAVRARQLARSRFSWERIAGDTLAAYRGLLPTASQPNPVN